MTATNFDEMQMAERQRTATITAVLMGALVFANGIICDTWRVWGSGLDQAFTIVFPALTYFVGRAIWGHFYFGRRTHVGWTMAVFAVLTAVYVVVLGSRAAAGKLMVWEHGQAGPSWQMLVLLVFLATALVTSLLRAWADRRAND